MAEQILRELQGRGIAKQAATELVGPPAWVSVHVARREADKRAFIGDRRGQAIRLRFAAPVTGPIRLGHSSSFGLGLFQPVPDEGTRPRAVTPDAAAQQQHAADGATRRR